LIAWAVALAGLAALAASLAWAAGDSSFYREEQIVITQSPGGQQMTTLTKSWIKGVKMRTEASGGDVTIVRPDLQKVYNINLLRKQYVESPYDMYRKAASLSLAVLGASPEYSWTNRKKKIGRWQCREVVVAEETGTGGERLKTIWWVSDDGDLDKSLFRRVLAIGVGDQPDASSKRFFDKLAGIPGYPVQTESSLTRGAQTIKTVNTLQKLERREVEDSLFDLPAGLTKIVVPTPEGM
jgi:hypothetical protein